MTTHRSVRLFLIAFASPVWLVTGSPVHGCQDAKDYADVSQEALGVKPVTPEKDPKTGFVVGGMNETSLIRKLKEINGITIEALEKSMRPDELSRAGFLGKDENLSDVMAEDNDWVTNSGLTHQELARHLRVLTAIARREPGAFTYHEVKFSVRVIITDGFQDSPFMDGTRTNIDVVLLNMDTNAGLKFSPLVPLMVERYGFYEGQGTSFRVDPREIVGVLTFLRPSKGTWSYKNGKPESVTFDYGTQLTAQDIDQLSSCTSLTRIVMGYAGVDSEFVAIEGDLWKLGRLTNLEDVHLCVDAMNDDDLKFIALLPKLQTLEFNADNGYDAIHEIPICTDRCGDHLRSAKTLRSLVIHDGKFTDKFVAKITEGLPNLEVLSLNSAELTDESLRLLSERCKKLKSLSIASDHFTAEGLKHLDKLKDLEERAVSSPALRKRNDPKEILRLLGTWEYVSATYEGKPIELGKNETITLTEDDWTLRRNGKLISRSKWEIDSTRSPKWLTQFTEGGKVNFLDRWVYKFDEEQLVLCKSSWMDERRPTEFMSQEGDKQYLIVLRRIDTKGKPE